jgi:hypothetical protein
LLRDPIERVISHYYFVLRQPTHYLHQAVTAQSLSLRDYVSTGLASELDNGQTRYLAGALDLPFGACSRRHLELAKQNLLRHFAVVGLVERFDETVLMAKKLFAWKHVYYTPDNVTRDRPRREQLAASDLAAMEGTNVLDLELYDFAKVLFEKQRHSFLPGFMPETELFRSMNRCYQDYVELRAQGRFIKAFLRRAFRTTLVAF